MSTLHKREATQHGMVQASTTAELCRQLSGSERATPLHNYQLSQQVHQHLNVSLPITDAADAPVFTAFLPHSHHGFCIAS
jgi:hypothetical protein